MYIVLYVCSASLLKQQFLRFYSRIIFYRFSSEYQVIRLPSSEPKELTESDYQALDEYFLALFEKTSEFQNISMVLLPSLPPYS